MASAEAAGRARESYEAMCRFLGTDHGLWLDSHPRGESDNPYAFVWPYSQGLAATIAMIGIDASYEEDAAGRVEALESYWNAESDPPGYDSYVREPYGQGGDKYYDDNEWVGLALVQHYKRTGDLMSLARAEEIFRLVVNGWDTDDSHPYPGGVFWTQGDWNHDRNTVSTGPGAQLGLQLYLLSNRRRYLHWGQRMFEWVNGFLLAPNGLYWDHVDLEGNVEKTQWSYNQGVMLGAATLLHKATKKDRYLEQARSIAHAALAFYEEEDRWFTQPAKFNAIFFRNLLFLGGVAPDPAYREIMEAYADKVWNQARDPGTGLFRVRDPGSGLFDRQGETGQVTLTEQAAMVQIYALLAWPPDDYALLT